MSKEFFIDGYYYTIAQRDVVLDESVELFRLQVEGWGNKRYLFIDLKKRIAYFEVTSAHEDGRQTACSICASRMSLFSRLHGHSSFVTLQRYASIYMKIGLPEAFEISDKGFCYLLRYSVST